MCLRGASALDELLAKFPDSRIRVQVVWLPVLKTDVVPPLDRVLGLIDDPRVVQYWDPDRVVSTDIVRAVNADPTSYRLEEPLPPDFIAWDVVAVFEASQTWDRDLPVPVYYGGPVGTVMEETGAAIRGQRAGGAVWTLYSTTSRIVPASTTYFCAHSLRNGSPVDRTVPDSLPNTTTVAARVTYASGSNRLISSRR
jgi:hypothetical protein